MAIATGGGTGEGGGGAGAGWSAVFKGLTDVGSMYQAQVHARQQRRAARAIAGALRALLQFQMVQAKIARDRWLLDMQERFPGSPVYGPLTPVEFVDLPTRLTTKQTKINQLLMASPDSKRLQAKQAHVARNIERFKARHPEAVTTKLVTRK